MADYSKSVPFLTIPVDLGMTDDELRAAAQAEMAADRTVPQDSSETTDRPHLRALPLGEEAGPHGDPDDLSLLGSDALTMARQLFRMADMIEKNARDYAAQSRMIATRLEAIARASSGPRFALEFGPTYGARRAYTGPEPRAIDHGSRTANVVYGTEASEVGDLLQPWPQVFGPTAEDGVIPAPGSQAQRGDLLPGGTIFAYDGSPISTETAAKFWKRVIRTSDHWVWRGARSSKTGRPMVRMQNRMWYSHRIAYTLHTGRDIAGQYLKLTCAELMCVRPTHHVLSLPGDPRVTDGSGNSLVPEIPESIAASVYQARTLVVAPYRSADGQQKYCRMGHAMSLQPSGRPTCRPCDRERQAASYSRRQQSSRGDLERHQLGRELTEAIDSAPDDPEGSPVNLVASGDASRKPVSEMTSEEFAADLASMFLPPEETVTCL